MLLHDVNSSKYLSLSFWKYDRFSLDDAKNDKQLHPELCLQLMELLTLLQ